MAEQLTVLVMAAGKGTRMRSALPKVLHSICGRPMVEWAIEAARAAGATDVVCVTRPGDGVADGLPEGVRVAEQTEGEGTGAAVLAAREAVGPDGSVMILSGDHPLISAELLGELVAAHDGAGAAATLLTTEGLDPAGYGRIVRGADGSVERIVETKDPAGVAPEVLATREVNLGTYVFDSDALFEALDAVGLEGGETYLTGVFPLLREQGRTVAAHVTADLSSAVGVNSKVDLMDAERLAQRRILERHALAGVSFLAPDSARVEVGVEIGGDTTIGPGVTLRGDTRIGAGCEIGPQTTIADSSLADGVSCVHSFVTGARIEAGGSVGPFAYLRPGAHIGEGAKVGTFVEVKNSEIGAGAKVPHLSYLGDADVGDGANVAAGNITANYDGFRKHRTKIGAGARTGVNSSFVAPVTVGDGAYIGAGSVISEDVPPGALGISRPEQRNVDGYTERIEKERG
ncbi:MAG TPA: bifunctional UDP-N-acetylglucosamine diphosphorylase/glucosamine-1-phosphate N-acetyltransferase GlmU [Thermoleophilaceae bacterium]|nr:bifunctional UDP-N-acetylglucosamine diphosphorylase/glucosamine-1-phosphate N-acetyltransferase GlmU [Thermoleophilaceae bacterium]